MQAVTYNKAVWLQTTDPRQYNHLCKSNNAIVIIDQ